MKILSLQPFYGGSHRQFVDQWIARSCHQWEQETLPDRHWKWRMRHSAIEFAQRVDRLWQTGHRWDAVLTTDMLNVAEFKGLLKTGARQIPIVVYFHENQFEYPNQTEAQRDFHFAFTNLTSALVADVAWFNSRFNLNSMVSHLQQMMKVWPDFAPVGAIEKIVDKSFVQYPGISFETSKQRDRDDNHVSHIVWAGRWEHDKNPEMLFDILTELETRSVEFRLSVIGQQFRKCPGAFDAIQQKFSDRIENWGYLVSRDEYFRVIKSADIFLSTASHEFFGLSAAEAMASGCTPVLPNRLAYPELLNVEKCEARMAFLFDTVSQATEILKAVADGEIVDELTNSLCLDVQQRFGWENRAPELDRSIESMMASNDT